MRTHAVLAALAVLAAGTVPPAGSFAQGTPSPDQIVKSLTPTGPSSGARGLRITPAAPGAAGAATSHTATPTAAVSLTVQFLSGSAELTPEAMRVLDNLGKALNDQALASYRFRIEGHTDTVGTREYNQELSERRAAAVVDYLADRFRVDRARIKAVGMGEDGLLVATPDQTPEPRNRRVQVVNVGS
jgi:outer membrane protein OmpA-like peptidoglycan-associated protein